MLGRERNQIFYIQLSELPSVTCFLSVRVLICHHPHLLLCFFLRPARSSCFLLSSQLFQLNVWHFRLEISAIQLRWLEIGEMSLEGNKEENGWLKTIQAFVFPPSSSSVLGPDLDVGKWEGQETMDRWRPKEKERVVWTEEGLVERGYWWPPSRPSSLLFRCGIYQRRSAPWMNILAPAEGGGAVDINDTSLILRHLHVLSAHSHHHFLPNFTHLLPTRQLKTFGCLFSWKRGKKKKSGTKKTASESFITVYGAATRSAGVG